MIIRSHFYLPFWKTRPKFRQIVSTICYLEDCRGQATSQLLDRLLGFSIHCRERYNIGYIAKKYC
jgi:hypothetical protein